jgi:nicotinamide-nucleotide amidase
VTWPEPTSDRVHVLVDTLVSRSLTVATAESLTGGLLGALITAVPGASATFRGGLIVYATDLKASLAHVDPALLAAGGPVQRAVAVQLADGVRAACSAMLGVGLTGVAGPDPVDGRPAGTWFVAVTGPKLTLTRDGTPKRDGRTPTRAEVRADAVAAAVELLELAVAGQ